ncbi:hypothetical protein IG631_21835 [Alternaria alternata]|nr:hypothetical protein IG631_21835 [Alternaria alternata]
MRAPGAILADLALLMVSRGYHAVVLKSRHAYWKQWRERVNVILRLSSNHSYRCKGLRKTVDLRWFGCEHINLA